MFVDFIFQI